MTNTDNQTDSKTDNQTGESIAMKKASRAKFQDEKGSIDPNQFEKNSDGVMVPKGQGWNNPDSLKEAYPPEESNADSELDSDTDAIDAEDKFLDKMENYSPRDQMKIKALQDSIMKASGFKNFDLESMVRETINQMSFMDEHSTESDYEKVFTGLTNKVLKMIIEKEREKQKAESKTDPEHVRDSQAFRDMKPEEFNNPDSGIPDSQWWFLDGNPVMATHYEIQAYLKIAKVMEHLPDTVHSDDKEYHYRIIETPDTMQFETKVECELREKKEYESR